MTPFVPDAFEGERRGSDDAPAEGRRGYDLPDMEISERLGEFEKTFTRSRNIIIVIALLWGAYTGVGKFFGYTQGSGPGQQIEELKHGQATLRDTVIQWHDERLRDNQDMRMGLYFLLRKSCSMMSDTEVRDLGGSDVCDAAWHPLDHAIKAKLP